MAELAERISRMRSLRAARTRVTQAIRRADAALAAPGIWTAAAIAVLALQAALIVTHDPWLDEFQGVQLAVQAPDVPTLLEWLHYEGHPPLFYLILRGMAHLMDPLATLPVFALACAAITQGAILLKSPFTRAERLLLATSEFVLFEFLTLSRSMTLGVTLLVLAMVLWRRRWVWLAIALLPMCDFLFGVLSGMLVLLQWREKRLWWPGVALWLAVGLAAAWSVRPAPDALAALTLTGFGSDLLHYVTAISTLALPWQGGLMPVWNAPPWPLAGVLWIAFLWFAWVQTRGDRFHRTVLFGFIALTFVFSMAVYPLAIRHLMLIALLLILLTWRRRVAGERPGPGFRLWLTVASVCGLATAGLNLVMPFDTAGRTVAEIRRLGLAGKHWMVFPDSRAQGVAALGGMQFERTERHCMQSFIRWNYRSTLLKRQRLETYLRGEIARHGRSYLLSDIEINVMPRAVLRPIANVDNGYDGQEFYLYEVGTGAPEKPVWLPPCVPGARPLQRLP